MITSRAQSFTSLIVDLAGALMEHFLEGIALLRHKYINPNEKSLNGAPPTRKYSIKTPAKCKISIYGDLL